MPGVRALLQHPRGSIRFAVSLVYVGRARCEDVPAKAWPIGASLFEGLDEDAWRNRGIESWSIMRKRERWFPCGDTQSSGWRFRGARDRADDANTGSRGWTEGEDRGLTCGRKGCDQVLSARPSGRPRPRIFTRIAEWTKSSLALK